MENCCIKIQGHFYDLLYYQMDFQKDGTNLQSFKQGFTARSPLLSIIIFFSLTLPIPDIKTVSHCWFNLHILAQRALK